MTNEQIVEEIRNGINVTDNMERLYLANLPLIRKYILPYTGYDSGEDLLQEAYFGLVEAVKHYESSENVLFMTYARYWIKQQVSRYIGRKGSVLKIPDNIKQEIIRYKKDVEKYQQAYGMEPTNKQIAEYMGISFKELRKLQICMKGIMSVDAPVNDEEDLLLLDTLETGYNLENEVVEGLYYKYEENTLWDIVDRFTDKQQQNIIKQHYKDGKSIAQIARETGACVSYVRTLKNNGLRKLRTGKANREIRERLEELDSRMFRAGARSYKEHDFTSVVEYIALQKMEMEKRYKGVLSV